MIMMSTTYPPGTAPIQSQYVVSLQDRPFPDDDDAEGDTSLVSLGRPTEIADDVQNAPTHEERPHMSGAQRKKLAREEKKKRRGQNKGRRFQKVRDELDLCWKVAVDETCEFGSECRFTHDVEGYLSAKLRDIKFPALSDLTTQSPFVLPGDGEANNVANQVAGAISSLDPTAVCPVYSETGKCRQGFKCRFLGAHVKATGNGFPDQLSLVIDEDKAAHAAVSAAELNFVDSDVRKQLRTRKYPRPVSDAYLKEIQQSPGPMDGEPVELPEETAGGPKELSGTILEAPAPQASNQDVDMSQVDTPDTPMRFAEKKRLHWSGKTYLAPLTTVGNLPFRRLCVSLGADITCGEMGLATSFLAGSKEEWSLVRRHPAEQVFGVQLAGNKPATLVPATEAIGRECGPNIDFVDLNCGCPIDLVFKSGSGSALLDSPGKLGKILIGMNKALGEVPVTIKLRTGVKDGRNTAHKLMPRIASEWGVGCMTLHGRTRQQRYQKLADWDYIKECVAAVREKEEDMGLSPIPIFGGGDAFSSQDYWEKVGYSGVDGVMVARGALIKPWIFTEVKERREWDISSRERLELIRSFAEYGLSHFSTDTAGVNTTRRYLCEALSFQYRYVPIGLLECLPGKINDRPPAYRGRDELETLLSSPDSRDWVKISEMFLGPAPEGWNFLPKHKSNAYESQG